MGTSKPDYISIYSEEISKNNEKEFLKDECYLDHAGATLYSKSQIKNVMDELSTNLYGNPHSLGTASKYTAAVIDQMRFRILEHFHTNSDEYSVIFTSGATSSMKTIADEFSFGGKKTSSDETRGHFVYTQDNHTSILGMREVVSQKGAQVTCLGHDAAFELFQKIEIGNGTEESLNAENDIDNSIFAFPAQCNFSGMKYPLEWIHKVHNGALNDFVRTKHSKWFVLLDAAGYVGTNSLDLTIYKPDFVCLSFYKMFGYPTGIGALLIKNSSQFALEKSYYGGGTVQISLSSQMFHVKRPILHERFEDGTLPFLSIISLRHGFDALNKIPLESIGRHVFSLARYLHHSLLKLHHYNGQPLANLYSDTDYEDVNLQGGIVAFNLMRSNGEEIGFVEFSNMADLHKIHVRTGCFCNPGACQRHLNLTDEELKMHFNAGHVCGDERDLIGGKPTGAIRVSFGYMSTVNDVNRLLEMIKKCFLVDPAVIQIPSWWKTRRENLLIKYNKRSGFSGKKTVCDNSYSSYKSAESAEYALLNKTESVDSTRVKYGRVSYLKHLFIYPVKSCGSYEVSDSWILGPKGLSYDREWMVTTSSGVCLTQKQEIKLCLITPRIDLKKRILEFNYPGMPSMEVPLNISCDNLMTSSICRSKICGHKVEGIDCGPDVSEWLSLALGRPGLRLIKQSTENGIRGPELSFSSQAQYLLINKASTDWLADKIPQDGECDNDTILSRFRGNMIIEGSEAFEEMKWSHVRIGNVDFQVSGPCTRCQMICIDQCTGKKTVEPLRTLAQEFHGKMRFGIYLNRSSSDSAVLRLGDEIHFKCEL